MNKLIILSIVLFSLFATLHAEDNYCYQKPDKCAAGDILILALSEDVAKYCDFDKQITALRRHTTSSSFNNQEVVCVKIETPRKKLK
ncbi:MAG: hypothetical protein GKR92_13450 [Gammaproteobacteria bacterium]|nr:MAG: hypothetical protein GKR92_00080 [Gammaproteobacteria bacterium]QMU62651.1 MAG: hypothetical protein GKR92_13450 [Gammaproteobacteria bacterium]